jgi:hypothetical protein
LHERFSAYDIQAVNAGRKALLKQVLLKPGICGYPVLVDNEVQRPCVNKHLLDGPPPGRLLLPSLTLLLLPFCLHSCLLPSLGLPRLLLLSHRRLRLPLLAVRYELICSRLLIGQLRGPLIRRATYFSLVSHFSLHRFTDV